MNYRCSLGEGIKSLSTVYIQYVLDVIVQNRFPVFRMNTVDRLFCPPPEGSNTAGRTYKLKLTKV
jgi:hypothetical protein